MPRAPPVVDHPSHLPHCELAGAYAFVAGTYFYFPYVDCPAGDTVWDLNDVGTSLYVTGSSLFTCSALFSLISAVRKIEMELAFKELPPPPPPPPEEEKKGSWWWSK